MLDDEPKKEDLLDEAMSLAYGALPSGDATGRFRRLLEELARREQERKTPRRA